MKVITTLLLFISVVLLVSCENDKVRQRNTKTPGVTDSAITLGSSAALSGHAGFLGTQYLRGAQAYFNYINSQGGIHGRKVFVVAYDDSYNPIKTVANTQKLISEDKVFSLFNYVGTPTSVAVKPTIKSADIPIFGFFTGAESLRKPVEPNIFHLRDSYYAEAEGTIRYFVDLKKLEKVAVLYQDDAFGMAVLKGIQLALQERGMEPVVTDTYTRGSLELLDSLEWIFSKSVDVVIMVGTYEPLAKFIKEAHKMGENPYFSSVSFVGSAAFSHELTEVQKISPLEYEKILVTQVVPWPYSTKYPSAIEYIELSSKYYPEDAPNYVAFEGFLNAKVVVEALKRVGIDLTREKFIKSLSEIRSFDLGIEKSVNFSSDNHQGLSGIYYSQLKESKWFETFTPARAEE